MLAWIETHKNDDHGLTSVIGFHFTKVYNFNLSRSKILMMKQVIMISNIIIHEGQSLHNKFKQKL